MSRSIEEALGALGVAADSDPETVAHAYRRRARETHPDVSPDPDAAHRFATVAAAYRLLAARLSSEPQSGPDGAAGTVAGRDATDEPVHAADPVCARVAPPAGTDDRTPARMVMLAASPFIPTRPSVQRPIVAGPVVVRAAGRDRTSALPEERDG